MLITKQWLLNNSEKFWCDLFLVIYETSPYFGRLTWKLRPELTNWPFFRLDFGTLDPIRTTIREAIPDNVNEEQILRHLMTIIFYVAPDYNRNRIVLPEHRQPRYNEWEEEIMRQERLERVPRYPGYHVDPAPANYRPLKLEEIQEEDVKKFKQKVKLLGSLCSEKLLAGYRNLKDYYRERENQVKEKLTTWTQLITNRHV